MESMTLTAFLTDSLIVDTGRQRLLTETLVTRPGHRVVVQRRVNLYIRNISIVLKYCSAGGK